MKGKLFFGLLLGLVMLFSVACNNADTSGANGNSGDANETNDSGETSEVTPITVWYWGSESADLEQRVNEHFDDVDFVIDELPSGDEFKTRLQTTFSGGGDGPDIVAMDAWISEFLPNDDLFVNLYDYASPEELEETYVDWKLNEARTADGEKLIGLPIDIGPLGLYYRADLFEEAGLPSEPEEVAALLQTWDDYLDATEQVKEATGAGMYTIDEIFRNLISQSELLFFDEDDHFIGDQEHMRENFDTAVEAYQRGLVFESEAGPEKRAAMNAGDVGSLIHAIWFRDDVIDSAPDHEGEWRVTTPPGGGGNQGGSFFVILESSENPDKAYEVLEWMLNPENQLQSLNDYGKFPATPSVYDDPEMVHEIDFFGGQDINTVFAEVAQDVPVAYRGPNHELALSPYLEELQLVVSQDKDPEQAWNDAIDRVQLELSR